MVVVVGLLFFEHVGLADLIELAASSSFLSLP
jgi:hypothetical protein